ncbi:MAG: helix-turn-helix domain-containing protein [Inquilinaceae bacterium]
MDIRTPLDIGLIVRDRRRQLALSQSDLAQKVGVGRQWLVAVEHGKAGAEIGLVLRTLAALDLILSISTDQDDHHVAPDDSRTRIDIDALLAEYTHKKFDP